ATNFSASQAYGPYHYFGWSDPSNTTTFQYQGPVFLCPSNRASGEVGSSLTIPFTWSVERAAVTDLSLQRGGRSLRRAPLRPRRAPRPDRLRHPDAIRRGHRRAVADLPHRRGDRGRRFRQALRRRGGRQPDLRTAHERLFVRRHALLPVGPL